MKRKIIIFIIFVWAFLSANAHSPNNDSLIVYIDNIFVGKRSCVNFNKLPLVLLENFYCEYLLECGQTELSNNDFFSLINPKAIKQLFIEKNNTLNTGAILHIRTKKAKDGYLLINKSIMEKVADLDCNLDSLKVSYVYNNKIVTTKKDVIRILGLREKHIKISEILQDELSGVITIYIYDK